MFFLLELEIEIRQIDFKQKTKKLLNDDNIKRDIGKNKFHF